MREIKAKLISMKSGGKMGQVNLYKIDISKKKGFIDNLSEKFEFIGEQNYNSISDE